MEITDIIHKTISSQNFKNKLASINLNYPNLKQESFIRNTLLEIFNESYSNSKIRAFAEHPRKKGRTDLSIVNLGNNAVFKIELKFQFTKDDNNFIDYGRIVKKDFVTKESDLFILIVCSFDEKSKKEFDEIWDISSKLVRYQSKTNCWNENIINCFNEFFDKAELKKIDEIKFSKPYPTQYNFYLLNKIIAES